MNHFLEVFKSVLHTLEEHRFDYMVVGSVASMVYGEPRLTRDMDVVIELTPHFIPQMETLFPPDQFYLPPPEVLSHEVINRRQFNMIHHESGLKVDFILRKETPHAREEFQRRRKMVFFEGLSAFMASPEDIILKKLSYYQEGQSVKHLDDIRGILANTEVDTAYLQKWIQSLQLEKSWDQVR